MSRAPARTYNDLPMFAADADLATVFMGPGKSKEWEQIATLLEGRGLPKIDALMGGRYKPAVRAFFDREYGLVKDAPRLAPDGVEKLDAWRDRPRKRVRRA